MAEERKLNIEQEIELLREVAGSAIKLLSPPYRRLAAIRLPSNEKELDDWDSLREALIKAGYDWEEFT